MGAGAPWPGHKTMSEFIKRKSINLMEYMLIYRWPSPSGGVPNERNLRQYAKYI